MVVEAEIYDKGVLQLLESSKPTTGGSACTWVTRGGTW